MTSSTGFSSPSTQLVDPGANGTALAGDAFTSARDADPKLGVALRGDAGIDADVVRLVDARAVKINAWPNRSGQPSGMRSLETHLHVEAWVKNATFGKNVWIDVHVVSDDMQLVHSETYTLRYERAFGDGGDLFVMDSELFQGSVATQGSVTLRPDVRHVEFRLYAEMDGRVSTDGLPHRCELLPDPSTS
jgi:hypothetical protein